MTALKVGQRITVGAGEDRDTGIVGEISGDQITVQWDSGVVTTQSTAALGYDTYYVAQYEESPVEPKPAIPFARLSDARQYARQHFGGRRDSTLAGDRYDDGTRHIEAYYTNEHQSSGCWITMG